ncbi:MAG: FAD:protein FMN transferase [Eudoraea sp.]|nr:FAD:protein FMN transferase [Eudoraea sp.]
MRRPILLILLLSLFGCMEQPRSLIRNDNSGPALGTSYNIIYLADRELDFQEEIDSVFQAVNKSMSTYLEDSDITRINNGDSTIVVDQMFREVFELSLEVYRKTDGFFDPTVGVLVNAWGFGPGEQLPLDSIKVDSLLQFVGFQKVRLTEENRIIKENPGIQFDFNAIAKGYTLDRLAVLLDEKGIDNYLVELGGEVVTKGENTIRQKLWKVGIEDPQNPGGSLKTTIPLKNRALASSGNYRKYRIDENSGEKYVHTIDPKSGLTKNSRILGANVLAASCAEADAYATAFMAMDISASKNLLNHQEDIDAYLIYLGENGATREFMTPGFRALLNP